MGSNTITTSANVSANLEVGARIRLGAAGAVTTADTLGADTYTITAIAGTTITVQETLTANYTADALYRGLVSQWSDKSGNTNHAAQGTESRMPLWVDNKLNGNSVLNFTDDYLVHSSLDMSSDYSAFYSIQLTAFTLPISYFHSGNIGAGGLGFYSAYPSGPGHQRGWSSAFNDAGILSTNETTPFTWNLRLHQPTQLFKDGLEVSYSSTATVNGNNFTHIGTRTDIPSFYHRGNISEIILYDETYGGAEKSIIDQYQSAKWGLALDPVAGAGTEAAEAMSASGYSAFTTDYLERLSNTADIILQADNTISLDLQGDSLTLTDDRSITLRTTNGDISTLSAGNIITNRTTTGGNISFDAGGVGDININHDLTLNAQNGGEISFSAGGGDINLKGDMNFIADNFNVTTTGNFNVVSDNFNVTGNMNGSGTGSFDFKQSTAGKSIDVGSGGTGDIKLSNSLISDIKGAFANYSFGHLDGGDVTNYTATWEDPVTFLSGGDFTNNVSTSNDDTILARAGGDVTLNASITTTSSKDNALVLSADNNFINNAGSNALSAINSRWLVYSNEATENTFGALIPESYESYKRYITDPPSAIGYGNRFIFAGESNLNQVIPNTVTITSQEPKFEIDSSFDSNFSSIDTKSRDLNKGSEGTSPSYSKESSTETSDRTSDNTYEQVAEEEYKKKQPTKTESKNDKNSESKSQPSKSTTKKILHGSVEIHPVLVELFNLDKLFWISN